MQGMWFVLRGRCTLTRGARHKRVGPCPRTSLRVDVFDDGVGFHLPCPQYQRDRCATYQRRPRVCVDYECELLQHFLAGQVTLEDSLSLVTQVKEILDKLWAQLPGGKAMPITFETLRAIVGRVRHAE